MYLQFTLRRQAGKDFTGMFALIFPLLESRKKNYYHWTKYLEYCTWTTTQYNSGIKYSQIPEE